MDQEENINLVEDEVVESPEPEEAQDEVVETPEEEETEEEVVEEEPVEEEEAKQPSRRESLRIQKLIEKLKDNEKKPSSLPQLNGLNYADALDADPDTVEQLNKDRQNYAEQAYYQGLEQAKSLQFHTRLEIDAPKVMSRYKELDPENKEFFNPAVADAINTWYLNTTGYNAESDTVSNPTVRYAEFVDSVFELANAIAGEKVQKSVKNLAKQAATTGLRPDGSSVKRLDLNKPLNKMSDEELKAYGKQLGL